jgi:hypothetical protein
MTNKSLVLIGIILILIIVGVVIFGVPGGIVTGCDEIIMDGVSCTDATDCSDYFAGQGAPASWLNEQGFNCKSGQCYIVPSECDITFTEIE